MKPHVHIHADKKPNGFRGGRNEAVRNFLRGNHLETFGPIPQRIPVHIHFYHSAGHVRRLSTWEVEGCHLKHPSATHGNARGRRPQKVQTPEGNAAPVDMVHFQGMPPLFHIVGLLNPGQSLSVSVEDKGRGLSFSKPGNSARMVCRSASTSA